MHRKFILAAAMSIAAIAAHAESPDPSGQFAQPVTSSATRSQVLAELREAQRTGDLLAVGEQGVTLYEQNPGAYPARTVAAGKSRDEVRAETLQAIREGDIIVGGELGLTARQLNPQHSLARSGSDQREQTASESMTPGSSAD